MGEIVQITYKDEKIPCYLATPNGESKGGVIVIHEIWGLNEHQKDIANRLATDGYTAFAPDLLSETDIEEQITPQLQQDYFNPERRLAIQPKIREIMTPMQSPEFGEIATLKLKTCFDYLYNLVGINNKVGVIGFCFGGTYSFNLAVNEDRLRCAVPFYGHSDQTVDQLKQIKCPVMAFYGQDDDALISEIDNLKGRMNEAGVNFTYQIYPGCGHAFFNDTNPITYNEVAAKDSWQKTLAFLQEYI